VRSGAVELLDAFRTIRSQCAPAHSGATKPFVRSRPFLDRCIDRTGCPCSPATHSWSVFSMGVSGSGPGFPEDAHVLGCWKNRMVGDRPALSGDEPEGHRLLDPLDLGGVSRWGDAPPSRKVRCPKGRVRAPGLLLPRIVPSHDKIDPLQSSGAHQAPRRGRPRAAAGVGEGLPPPQEGAQRGDQPLLGCGPVPALCSSHLQNAGCWLTPGRRLPMFGSRLSRDDTSS